MDFTDFSFAQEWQSWRDDEKLHEVEVIIIEPQSTSIKHEIPVEYQG